MAAKDVRVILLAARGVKDLPETAQKRFSTSLEWLVHAYKENGIKHISIVGGKDIETLRKKYPTIKFYYDPAWETAGMLSSMFLAKEEFTKGDCIVSYADVVYRPSLIKRLLEEHTGDLTLVTDTRWKTRYPGRRKPAMRTKAEKVWADKNGRVTLVHKKSGSPESASGEFAGVCFIPRTKAKEWPNTFEKLSNRKGKFHEARSSEQGFLTDFFQELILKKKQRVHAMFIDGEWAEMDDPQDVGHFVFGTKSQTLDRLRPVLKSAEILPQYSFTAREWQSNRDGIVKNIRATLRDKTLIVRSSSLAEDSFTSSNAGAFTSVPNVPRDDNKVLVNAINEVVKSFGKHAHTENQILVQRHVANVVMSGVILTCDIKTGAPYYMINYDVSGSTDAVTAGKGADTLCYLYKHGNAKPADPHLKRIVETARELEQLTGSQTVDIEFGMDRAGKLFIFQARPITSNDALRNYYSFDTQPAINHAKDVIEKRLRTKPHLAGRTTILGDMPDWNPAELIGSHPKPLAASLFDELIAKEAWRDARKILGYFDPAPERLMLMLCGHPYIDVRNSLNSYTPESLPADVREKLVNESIEYLAAHPDAHDKLEFEVATTCYSPFIEQRKARWKKFGLSAADIHTVEQCFREHTQSIVRGDQFPSIANLKNRMHTLDSRRKQTIGAVQDFTSADAMRFLLQDCISLGTVPFSALARMAFIGQTFLKSFLAENIITKETYDAFLRSLQTVSGDMGKRLEAVNAGKEKLASFLQDFGHLRPGTYEIESPRYDEKPELYFTKKSSATKQQKQSSTHATFDWKNYAQEEKNVERALKDMGLLIEPRALFTFIKEAIEQREEAKFIFSRNVSDLLSLITKWGKDHGIDRETLSYLHLQEILMLADMADESAVREHAQLAAERAKQLYTLHQQIIMPQLIVQPSDVEWMTVMGNRPNFITTKRIEGETLLLEGSRKHGSLEGKIIMIESADPGYDWVFTHRIAGLVTKYGGAGSHMAIRCAEFGLPAAIGVGALFEQLTEQHRVTIDCANQRIA